MTHSDLFDESMANVPDKRDAEIARLREELARLRDTFEVVASQLRARHTEEIAAKQPEADHNNDGSLRCNLCWTDPCKCGKSAKQPEPAVERPDPGAWRKARGVLKPPEPALEDRCPTMIRSDIGTPIRCVLPKGHDEPHEQPGTREPAPERDGDDDMDLVDELQDFLDGMSLDASDSRMREALRRVRAELARRAVAKGGKP